MFNRQKLVKCAECKHLIEEIDAQKVMIFNSKEVYKYFCPEHRKDYKYVLERYSGWNAWFPEYVPAAMFEVDDDGEPKDYVRKDESKRKYTKTGKYSKKNK